MAPFSYDAAAAGSHAAWWWPGASAVTGRRYTLSLSRADGTRVSSEFQIGSIPAMEIPRVDLTTDGQRLSWQPIPGALSYACRIYAGGQLQLSAFQSTPECDVSSLPSGSYSAAVLAFTADLKALPLNMEQVAELPSTFSVSEGRLAFARSSPPTSTLKLVAAGGALHYGSSQPGLAVWIALTQTDGSTSPDPWSIEIVGPGLSAGAPLRLTYPPTARNYLAWSYDVPALQGRYSVVATAGTRSISGTFTVGEPVSLDAALDVSATPGASGSATVQWSLIPAAKRYYVSVWSQDSALPVAAQWVTEPPARFDPGTFTSGRRYDVYVAATDVEALPEMSPSRVTVSENTYLPTSFTAP